MHARQLAKTIAFCAVSATTALAATAPTVAQTISDPATGLVVTLPFGYSAEEIQYGRDRGSVSLRLLSNTNSAYCIIVYTSARIPNQRQRDSTLQNWSDRFGKYSIQEKEFRGGYPLSSNIPKFDENYPLRPLVRPINGRMLSVDFKTSSKYLRVDCRAADKDYDTLHPLLDSVVRAISVPQ